MTTMYQSSKGPVAISTMPLRYARNALDKLTREEPGRAAEIAALTAHCDKLAAEEPEQKPLHERTVGDILDELPSNPRAVIGGNQPPEPTPFEAIKQEADDLYDEAKGWLDGEPIATDAQASEIAKLRDMLRDVKKRAEEQRVAEAKPFDEGKAAVQARYNPLIQKDRGQVDLAIAACNSVLAPFLKKRDDEQRAEAERLRQQAVAEAAAARDAAQAAASSGNLAERESAEDMLKQAKSTLGTMKQAEKAKPQIHHTGGGRAVGMKTIYHPELQDPTAAIEHYRKAQPAALIQWMIEQAVKDVRAGPKPPAPIPGFTFREEKVAV